MTPAEDLPTPTTPVLNPEEHELQDSELTNLTDEVYVPPPPVTGRLARAIQSTSLGAAGGDRALTQCVINFTVREDENGNVIPVKVHGHIPWITGGAKGSMTTTLKDAAAAVTAYGISATSSADDASWFGQGNVFETIEVPGDYERHLWLQPGPVVVSVYATDILPQIVPFIEAVEQPVAS